MYLVPLKTLLTEAIKTTFDAEYPVAEFRDLHASIEFPFEKQNYPGLWVDYNPVGSLQIAGVNHYEYAQDEGSPTARRYTRWYFKGHATFTVVALTSLERDRLYDEMVRVMAFGREDAATSQFRSYIEDNEFLAVNFDFDEIGSGGFANTLGTPWQTEEMIYEAEVSMECFGEFVSDNEGASLVPLSEVEVIPYGTFESDPTDPEGWQ